MGGRLPYQEIKQRCENTLKPLVSPAFEKTKFNGKTFGYSEAGYDIRIAQDITIYPKNLETLVNNFFFKKQEEEYWYMRLYNTLTGKILKYRESFILASTIEYFMIPDDIMPDIKDKSTWARQGITVQNTVGEPGWNGFLTLEITNHSEDIVHIEAGTPIAQMVFEQLTERTELPYKGKYQYQANRPVKAIQEE